LFICFGTELGQKAALLGEGKVLQAAYQPLGTVYVTNTVGVNVVNSAVPVAPAGTFSVSIQNTPAVIVVSSVPLSIGFRGSESHGGPVCAPQGTFSVSVFSMPSVVVNPTAVQYVAPQGTFSASVQNTVG